MILSSFPHLDLHGYPKDIALITLDEFINDSLKLREYQIVIIHGKGEGILRDAVLNYLKKDKRVEDFHLDFMNPGCTVAKLAKGLTK